MSTHNIKINLLRIFFAVMLLSCCMSVAAAETEPTETEPDCLMVHYTDGRMFSYVLEKKPTVTFEDYRMEITGTDFNDIHNIADVRKFTFDTESGLESVKENEQRITLLDNWLTLEGFPAQALVSLIDMQGRVIHTSHTDLQGYVRISLSPFQTGVYIVNVHNAKSFKILKK